MKATILLTVTYSLLFSLSAQANLQKCLGYQATHEDYQLMKSELEPYYDALKSDFLKNTTHPEAVNLGEPIYMPIILYTGPYYQKLNKELREDLPLSYPGLYRSLCGALTVLKEKYVYSGFVLRGVQLDSDKTARYKKGIVLQEKFFISTSRADGPCVYCSQNTNFRIKTKSGIDISIFSIWGNEHEILIPAGSNFLVKSNLLKGPKTFIDLEEVD